MAVVPNKVAERLASGLRRFQPIISSARARDVNEADTVVIIMDTLSELFGYDKYAEVTREHCIRGTYCDLAIKLEGKIEVLIEVKAIGLDLKENHVKQAIDYAANQGIEWVILTNGILWRIYNVIFAKPINQELVVEIDLLLMSPKTNAHIENLYLLTKESLTKAALKSYHDQQQATSRFFLASILLSDPVIEIVRRELRRITSDIKVQPEDIRNKLIQEVLKREVVEGPEADEARKKVQRAAAKALRAKKLRSDDLNGSNEGARSNEEFTADIAEELQELTES